MKSHDILTLNHSPGLFHYLHLIFLSPSVWGRDGVVSNIGLCTKGSTINHLGGWHGPNPPIELECGFSVRKKKKIRVSPKNKKENKINKKICL